MARKAAKKILSSEPELITINSLSHDGRGIATSSDGKTTFISGALPGEIVKYKMTKRHSRFNEGEMIDIIEASSDRQTPPCAHFGICGGCSMQHMTMPAQIALKQQTLLDQLKHFGQVTPLEIMPAISKNALGYRRKARLGVRYVQKKEKMLIGFREKASRYLAEIDTCVVLNPHVGMQLPAMRELVMSLTQFEHIPQIEVAVGDHSTALVIRHMTDLPQIDLDKICHFAKQYNYQIYLQPNPPAAIHKLWPLDNVDRLSYALADYDLEMQFHPLDFTQVNGEINPMMIQQAIQLLDPQDHEVILDLFCGLGNFTLPLARKAKQVVGIEGSADMVERAKANATHNNISNVEFHSANLAEITKPLPSWMQKHYDKILLDPARTGAKEILEFFPQWKPLRIVYVSCNPATLARDAGELVNKQGYQLKKVGVINMFPHTSHIEAIALFEK
jgi:23S rRNA (uracil1939-C5)-methyltransferase